MPNGKPHDDPLLDILIHGLGTYGREADDLIRKISDLSSDRELREWWEAEIGWKGNRELALKKARSRYGELLQRAKDSGWDRPEITDREGSGAAEFTKFELDLLNCFISYAVHPSLSEQLHAASLASREYTGVGLYLELRVPDDVTRIPSSIPSPISGPQILAPSLPNSGGSLLFFKNGLITTVEVFTYADEMWGDLSEYEFKTPDIRRKD
jgi:hypothetical protein